MNFSITSSLNSPETIFEPIENGTLPAPASKDSKPSPMMVQWHDCKRRAPDSLLLFRLGDFYEAFYEDAATISRLLDLTLTKRQEIPMCGVPAHTCEAYIDRLVATGHRVAIAEQLEDPKNVKGLVKREIVRVVTPGTLIQSSLLVEKKNNFILALSQLNACYGLAWIDLSTGSFYVLELETEESLFEELSKIQPKELLISEKSWKRMQPLLAPFIQSHRSIVTKKDESHFDHAITYETLKKHFQVHTLDGFGIRNHVSLIQSAGALLAYLRDDLHIFTGHLTTLSFESHASYMTIDPATQRHLELFTPIHDKDNGLSLFKLLDRTETPMGGRLLQSWMARPLLDPVAIAKRQDCIESLLERKELLEALKVHLSSIRDLERLITRIESGCANPRDLRALSLSLFELLPIQKALKNLESFKRLHDLIADFSHLTELLSHALTESPPWKLSDGNIFQQGFDCRLDELYQIKQKSHEWIASYQGRLRETTDIKTLKIGFTRAFGYYIEVSKGQALKIPEFAQRRQTLVNGERFVTEELKEFEQNVLTAEERISARERELFFQLIEEVKKESTAIRKTACAIAKIDVYASLAQVAKIHRYTRPKVDTSDHLHLEKSRHPVIESAIGLQQFIPNDVHFDKEASRLYLITGPNMAGKSTFIRQVALITLMAQMGSFVPAEKAHIGVVDKILSRIGASDDLSRGQSTFMVEMAETAHILRNATSSSLIILDEIGRGTSTYDGISLAWAIAEFLLTQENKKAKTLFATHYWELTELSQQYPNAKNWQVAIQEDQEGITFLHKIIPGAADKSYGIHVAKLAGIPHSVIERASHILEKLEKKPIQCSIEKERTGKKMASHVQMELFPSTKNKETIPEYDRPEYDRKIFSWISELKKMSIYEMTPIEALQKLAEWQKKLSLD